MNVLQQQILSIITINFQQINGYLLILMVGFLFGSLLHVFGYLWPILSMRRAILLSYWLVRQHQRKGSILLWIGPQQKRSRFKKILSYNYAIHCQKTMGLTHHKYFPLFYRFFSASSLPSQEISSWKYRIPYIELSCAGITLLCYLCTFSITHFIILLIISYVLVILFITDCYFLLLPNEITLLLIWFGLLNNLTTYFASISDAILGAIIGYLSFLLLSWISLKWTNQLMLGYGDSKLLAGLGACFGWQWLDKLVGLAATMGLITISLLALMRGKAQLRKPFPFGSCLALTALILLFYLQLTH